MRLSNKPVLIVQEARDATQDVYLDRVFLPRLYVYQELARNQFRLMSLHPGNPSAPLRCSISHHTIGRDDVPGYSCVSYTWKNTFTDNLIIAGKRIDYDSPLAVVLDIRHVIHCEDRQILVSTNLRDFLRSVRPTRGEPMKIWIDAICIDQENLPERSAQVAIMRQIYRNAANGVILWLGMPDDWTAIAFAFMPELAMRFRIGIKVGCFLRTGDARTEGINTDIREWFGSVTTQEEIRFLSRALRTWACLSGLIDPEQLRGENEWLYLLPTFNQCVTDDLEQCIDYALTSFELPTEGEKPWASLVHLFRRPCYRRSWILQEMGEAKKVRVTAGGLSLDLDDLLIAKRYLSNTVRKRPGYELYLEPTAQSFASVILRWRTGRGIGKEQKTMATIIHEIRHFAATDPRDKIYGVLPLFERPVNTGDKISSAKLITPNYQKSVQAVYTEATIRTIFVDNSFAILSTVDDMNTKDIKHLPSWVPDFSFEPTARYAALPFIFVYNDFRACGSTRLITLPSDPSVLRTRALFNDRVCAVAPDYPRPSTATYTQWAHFAEIASSSPYPTGAGRVVALQWTLCGGTYHLAGDNTIPDIINYRNAFEHLVECYAAIEGIEKKYQDIPAENILSRIDPGDLEGLQVALGEKDLLENEISGLSLQIIGTMMGRRLFVTERGYLGCTLPSVRPGDEVAIFSGGHAPFVLRKCPGSLRYYQMIGDCYIHGIMQGECVTAAPKFEDWRDISIR